MVTADVGFDVSLPADDLAGALFGEAPGRVLVQTTDPDAVREAFSGVAPTELADLIKQNA